LAGRCEIAAFWGLIFGKNGPNPDFGALNRKIRPFLTAIFRLKPNWAEIAAFLAVIAKGGNAGRWISPLCRGEKALNVQHL